MLRSRLPIFGIPAVLLSLMACHDFLFAYFIFNLNMKGGEINE